MHTYVCKTDLYFQSLFHVAKPVQCKCRKKYVCVGGCGTNGHLLGQREKEGESKSAKGSELLPAVNTSANIYALCTPRESRRKVVEHNRIGRRERGRATEKGDCSGKLQPLFVDHPQLPSRGCKFGLCYLFLFLLLLLLLPLIHLLLHLLLLLLLLLLFNAIIIIHSSLSALINCFDNNK